MASFNTSDFLQNQLNLHNLQNFHLFIGSALEQTGEVVGAIWYTCKAIELAERAVAVSPSDTDLQHELHELADAYYKMGALMLRLGQLEEAVRVLRPALKWSEERAANTPQDPQAQSELAELCSLFAGVYAELGKKLTYPLHKESSIGAPPVSYTSKASTIGWHCNSAD